jgi:soluble lytic murein transglycosylase
MGRLPTRLWQHSPGIACQLYHRCWELRCREAVRGFRSLRIWCRSVFAALLVLCVVPSPVGSTYQVPPPPLRPPPQLQQPPDPVNVVFRALSHCRPQLHARRRWGIAGAIHKESQRYGYDPLFVVALVEVESACLPTARSEDGAVGLIQLLPATARALSDEVGLRWRGVRTLRTPALNLHLGLRYLSQLEKRFRDPYLAIAAYNLGPTRVARMPRHRARRAEYVRKVLARYEALLATHARGRS